MNLSFDNKVALVTGATTGMGLATAQAFAEAVAAVVLADVKVDAVQAAAEKLVAAGHKALAVRCDVSDDAQVAAMVDRTVAEFCRLDAAFNNAGVMARIAPTADSTREDWDRVIGINLRGVWSGMKHNDAGRFMTLFYLALDLEEHRLRWVRAGHDPAVLYDPHGDTFQELRGRGMALGVDESFEYEENSVTRVGGGQIIAIGTDGIWEAHNKHGEMFGKARFRNALRRLAEMKVEGIIEGIFEELKEFTTGVQPEDDATLVVMRVRDGDI